jgi:hypothetical protein
MVKTAEFYASVARRLHECHPTHFDCRRVRTKKGLCLLFCLSVPSVVWANGGTNAVPANSVQVKFTGIAAMPPQKWAMLQVQKPGETPVSVLLKEGEQVSSVEIVQIDVPAGRICVRNAGVMTTVTLEKEDAGPERPLPDANHVPLPALPPADAGER